MATTIQVSKELKKHLENMKMNKGETYEDVIWDLIEDRLELSEETMKRIEKSRKEKGGITLEELKKKHGLK